VALLIGGTLAYFFLPFPWFIVVVVLLVAFEVVEARLWIWAIRRRPLSGHEGMVGERGVLATADRVRVRGTSYPARVLEGEPGDRIVVEGVDGMTLVVRRAGEDEW
jgi:membrane protein implicated in regulation of membrane protease activity